MFCIFGREAFIIGNVFDPRTLSDTNGLLNLLRCLVVQNGAVDGNNLFGTVAIGKDSILHYYVQNDRDSSFKGESNMNTQRNKNILTGKGTIQHKSNGKGREYYQVIRFPMRRLDDGTIEYKRSPCAKDRAQALQYQQELIRERERYHQKADSIMEYEAYHHKTVYEMLKQYVDVYVYPDYRAESSSAEMKRLIEKYVKPYIGSMRIDQCRELELQKFFNQVNVCREPYKLFNVLKRMYGWLEQQRIILSNPMKFAKNPKHVSKKQNREPLSLEDVQKLFKYMDEQWGKDKTVTRYRHAIKILFYTGMRPGELCGLERANIDFNKNTVLIRKTVGGYGEKEQIIRDQTKTECGQRVVSIAKCREDILAFFEAFPDSPWVVPNLNDWQQPCRPASITNALKSIGKKCGIERNLFAYLGRHTFITNAVLDGIPPTQLRYISGHADATMISRIYADHKDPRIVQRYEGTISSLYD